MPLDRTRIQLLTRSMALCHALVCIASAVAQEKTIVRLWNEETINGIRHDLARPPVHARNLFHINAAMYDAWAAYDTQARPWLLGRTIGSFTSTFPALATPPDIGEARKEAMTYAAYRMIRHRYLNSPGYASTYARLDFVMDSLGYDRTYTGTDATAGGPAALGNYIAQQYIAFGSQDGSNETGNYANQQYAPSNAGLHMLLPGNPAMANPNRWQPITLPNSIDQAGNPVASTPPFVGAEWGNVVPFCLQQNQGETLIRDGLPWTVYMDPGSPAQLNLTVPDGLTSAFKWNHLMVAIWQSHLDPADGVLWDISPGARGNNTSYPTDPENFPTFYDLEEGGDLSAGRSQNPITGLPYTPNMVKRGDYARVLAEFWADGVDSETPPGHWFVIMHDVMDKPEFERRWMGQGELMDPLEYDVKAHFTLGGAMHDAAITAWGIKGYYDSVRPVSAIRYMADLGQCSDPLLPRFHPAGAPLIPGLIEQVLAGDALVGENQEHLNKIKLYTYRGPDFVDDPATDMAGVGWILAENWWPYQRPTFVTPPFAGYISGHSTFSRTAAEVLTAMTGSPYFPGGIMEYIFPQNEFLVFEEGPSEDIHMQWATYQDASDACSLSRIWGGIHPAMDDIPGRLIGMELGPQAFNDANLLFTSGPPRVVLATVTDSILGPGDVGVSFSVVLEFDRPMDHSMPVTRTYPQDDPFATNSLVDNAFNWIAANRIAFQATLQPGEFDLRNINIEMSGGRDLSGLTMAPFAMHKPYRIDTHAPSVASAAPELSVYARQQIGSSGVVIHVNYDEACDTLIAPTIALSGTPDPGTFLTFNNTSSGWSDQQEYTAVYDLQDVPTGPQSVSMNVSGAFDVAGNIQVPLDVLDPFVVDTRTPLVAQATVSNTSLALIDVGSVSQVITFAFDEAMDVSVTPHVFFSGEDPLGAALVPIGVLSTWDDPFTCHISLGLSNTGEDFADLELIAQGYRDEAGNPIDPTTFNDLFSIDTRRPTIISATPSSATIDASNIGASGLLIELTFSEPMNTAVLPLVQPTDQAALQGALSYLPANSSWSNETTFEASFTVTNSGVAVPGVAFITSFARDTAGNGMVAVEPGALVNVNFSGVGVEETNAVSTPTFLPNPLHTGDVLYIVSDRRLAVNLIEVVDAHGRKVHRERILLSGTGMQPVQLPALAIGMYEVILSGPQERLTSRIVIAGN